MKIKCKPEKIKKMLAVTERLMRKADIQIRDTWDGYEGENYDNLRANEGRTDGPKVFDVQIVSDGVPRLKTEQPYALPGYKSQGYEVIRLLIPVRRVNDLDVIIHEAVHFLQHTTEDTDRAYFNLASQTVEDYRKFVDQQVEQEAHFVQLLYIAEFDQQKIEKQYRTELKKLLEAGLTDIGIRTDIIVFAKSIGVI